MVLPTQTVMWTSVMWTSLCVCVFHTGGNCITIITIITTKIIIIIITIRCWSMGRVCVCVPLSLCFPDAAARHCRQHTHGQLTAPTTVV